MSTPQPGRPPVTSRSELEQVALELFAERGFQGTTVEDIADAAGISRRTFFRYYPSKNDVVWGEFEVSLDAMDAWLAASDASRPPLDVLAEGVVRFNKLPSGAVQAHRQRMSLILHVPALQAHSNLRYADWRAVVTRYVARRIGGTPTDALPQLLGHVALGVAVASYERWLADESTDLSSLIAVSFAELREGFPSLTATAATWPGSRRS